MVPCGTNGNQTYFQIYNFYICIKIYIRKRFFESFINIEILQLHILMKKCPKKFLETYPENK